MVGNSVTTETLIIGAGPAGLAASYALKRRGRSHLVVERGRVAERWQSERWDSFTLLSPNWITRLPGGPYAGPHPDGFDTRQAIIDYFQDYAARLAGPIRTNCTVVSLEPGGDGHGYLAMTTQGPILSRSVIVATGFRQFPALPSCHGDLPAGVSQVHSSAYRNPDQLPPGAVLVVGSAASGQQIADELLAAGRRVYLAAGKHKSAPRRYRGRDIVYWMDRTGALKRVIEGQPEARKPGGTVVSGRDGGHDLNLHRLAARGATLLGHLEGVRGDTLFFAPDLAQTLAIADKAGEDMRRLIDTYIADQHLDAPPAAPDAPPSTPAYPVITSLNWQEAGVSAVVWATGFRQDLSWIKVPVIDETGIPIESRGVSASPGLFFAGQPWQAGSNFIPYLAEHAAYLATLVGSDHLVADPTH